MTPWHPTLKGFLRAARAELIAQWLVNPRRAIAKAFQTAVFLATNWFKPRVSEELYRAREEACFNCPAYDSDLQTCGTPGTPPGCKCYQPLRAKFQVNCWAFSLGQDWGWPHELNSRPGPRIL